MLTKLFVYGTLVHQSTLGAVLRRSKDLPKFTPARLDNFSKRGLNIQENQGDWVQGYLIEVDDSDLKKLDAYECIDDGMYQKIPVKILVNKELIEATAYQMP